MTAFGDSNPALASLYDVLADRIAFAAVDVEEGLLSAVAFWLSGTGAPVGDQAMRAVLYDAATRTLVGVSEEVVVAEGQPLGVTTFPVVGGVYWKGGKLLAGLWSGPLGASASRAGEEGRQNFIGNPNFQNPTSYIRGWTTSTTGGGTTTPSDVAEPLLLGGGVKVALAGTTGAGTWRPIHTDEPNAMSLGEAMATGLAGPTTRTIGLRMTVVVETQVTNANAPLRLMLRGAKIGFTFTPVLDLEVQAAQSAANLSTYPAGSVIELVGTAVVPATSEYGVGMGLAVDVTAGAAGALRVGKALMTFPALEAGASEVHPYFDGSLSGYMWFVGDHSGPSGSGMQSVLTYDASPGNNVAGGAAGRPYVYVTTSALTAVPELSDEEWAAYGWNTAQVRLAGQGTVQSGSRRSATVEWHHTTLDEHEGAFAVAREGGPLEEMVGDVLRVSYGDRSAYVYVVDASDDLDADLSLARRAFIQLANLSEDEVAASVEVLV
jgi:hypothetical protein